MTLSEAGCLRLWRAAQERRPEPWEAKHKCLSCPIGAKLAGISPEVQAAKAVAERLRCLCARCNRIAERGDRREPLVNGRHCVSCDNRRREAECGRNAKGNPPRLASQLHTQTILVGGTPIAFPNVVGRVEAMVLAAKAAASSGPIVIGRPALPAFVPMPPVVAAAAQIEMRL